MNEPILIDLREIPLTSKGFVHLWRRLLWESYGGICGICHQPVELIGIEVDHIIPRAAGGPDEWRNLQPAHRACNQKKQSGGVRRRPSIGLVNCHRCGVPFDAINLRAKYCSDPCRGAGAVRRQLTDRSTWQPGEVLKRRAIANEKFEQLMASLPAPPES